jgi:NTP pyrophosphatase (non-canonical NTP hydrolase)
VTLKKLEPEFNLAFPESDYTLNDLATIFHANAQQHGFHDGENNNMPSWVANLHGEVSELWEAYRTGGLEERCDKPIPLTCQEEELADIIIRALECAAQLRIDIDHAVKLKHEYNLSRPYRHGGKVA